MSHLCSSIKMALTAGLPRRLTVVGEVSNLSDRSHWFFSLKDPDASIRCVMFASAAKRAGVRLRDGMQVEATGRVDFYDAQGSVQLYVDRVKPVGEGALEAELRRLGRELKALGYFDPARKRALPLAPRRVAVVTSRSAAALQDVIDTARRRWPGCGLVLCDVRVQGPDAAPQVAAMVRRLSEEAAEHRIDAIILTRGGGSIEDLWAFNEREVCDAVLECGVPIIAAIGHETDLTLCELVADERCATPTQAAMRVVPERAILVEQLSQILRRMAVGLEARMESGRFRTDRSRERLVPVLTLRAARGRAMLERHAERLATVVPLRVERGQRRLDHLVERLERALPTRLERAHRELTGLHRTLDAVGPKRVLQRGFTLTRDQQGRVVRSAAAARAAGHLETLFADGAVRSDVRAEEDPAPERGGVADR